MTVLKAFRWALVVSIGVYVAAFALIAFDPELGALVGYAATLALAVSALGCVVTQIANAVFQRKHKSVEKPD